MTLLLKPFTSEYLGSLKNRVVMSAMTRGFADQNHGCTNLMEDYYLRRAKDGVAIILTEGMIVHPSGDGYNNVPHMWNKSHADSWKKTITSIHQTGSKIFCQLWHCGRISHEDYTGGIQPVSSTTRQAEGINRQNNKPFSVPRSLRIEEIPEIYSMFLNATHHALEAGFDGVELHLGHGYLCDQFFDARINDRTDRYGGSIENRCRFALELTEAVLKKYGSKKVIVRISPSRDMGGIYDWPDLKEMIDFLIPAFEDIGLKLLDISSARADYYETSGRIIRMVRPKWPHFLIGGTSLSHQQAIEEIKQSYLDVVTWGRFILANPDFVSRLKNNTPIIPMDKTMLKSLY